jgi:hypothetical protein
MTEFDPIPARLAALKTTPTPELKRQWRELFASEPPAFNRRYLESRLAYRIQELAYGGLKPETVKRLEMLGEQLDGGDRTKSRMRADCAPSPGPGSSVTIAASSRWSPSLSMASSGRGVPISRSRPLPAPSPARGGMAGCSSG